MNAALLAVDDGGSIETAIQRARALAADAQIIGVVALGYDAADESVQAVWGELPVIIVGNWLVKPQADTFFIFSNQDIGDRLSYSERLEVTDAAHVEVPFVGGEVFALRGFRQLRENLDGITVVTSGRLPNAGFQQRISANFQFADAPGVLAMDVYDAILIILRADKLPSTGWVNPPIHTYLFDSDRQLVDDGVE